MNSQNAFMRRTGTRKTVSNETTTSTERNKKTAHKH